MKVCYTYGLFVALFTLSACIPPINIGDKCASDSQCGLLQCHPDGYCTQPCNTNAQCPGEDYLCAQGMCQAGAGLSYECQNASECASQACATAECDGGNCLYHDILCDEPPPDYCNEDNTHYIQYAPGLCDVETNSCIYQATETECLGGCLETCHETCKETDCAQNENQCLENCVCDPQSPEGECVCSAKVHDDAQTPQCMLSDESAQNDGYCLEGKCVGCINDPQCTASQTDACIVSECHPTEYFCLDIVEPPDSAPVTEGTTHWSLEACTDQTPDDCWAPTCTLNSTDFALNGCLQNFLPRTGEACATLNGQNRECLEESGSCDETGACILDAKADGTACTASETEECTIANAICDNGSCAQNPTYESLGTACTDTDTNECTVARCDGAGTCDQNAANVAADIACTDTDTNDCKIAQCDGAGACDQNAANVANGTACTMLSNANLPNASNDPPSQDPGPDTLAGICASGICVNDDDAPTECEAEDDCKSPLHCCTAHALEANDGECGAQNKNICVECLSDGDCTKAGEGCCQGSCKKDCTRSAGVGEK